MPYRTSPTGNQAPTHPGRPNQRVDARGRDAGLQTWMGGVYQLFMITSANAVRDPQNNRYAEITLEPLYDVVRRILPSIDAGPRGRPQSKGFS